MIIALLGGCGSGKTYKAKNLIGQAIEAAPDGWRFLALDLNSEFPGDRWARRVKHTVAKSTQGARSALRAGRRYVIVRPGLDQADHSHTPWASLADEMARIAIENPAPTALVLPEAHTSMREGYPLPPHVGTIVHRFRHPAVRAGLVFDSQHFADVKKEALKDAQQLYLFATGSPQDLDAIYRYGGRVGGRQLVDAVRVCSERAAGGEPGWHVRLEILRPFPPYVPRRDPI